MQSNQSAPLLEDILLALGDKVGTTVTAEEVRKELQRYLDYGVPPAQARTTILRHYGVGGGAPAANAGSSRKTLAELRPNESFVNLLVRIVTIHDKEILVKGEKRTIQYGILGDESMTRSFTAWKPVQVQKGDVVKVIGAYTREYQGNVEVQLGDRVILESAPADSVPAAPAPRTLKVHDLAAGQSNVGVAARVLNVAPRSVTVQGTAKTVWSGILADDTGKVGFTSWHDFGLREGQALRIQGGYVRSFRGAPQFTFDEKATVEPLADDAVASTQEIESAGPTPVAELYLGSGALDVVIEATLVEVRPNSGLVYRCPECKRTLQGDACLQHGKVQGQADLRIKAVLDDGTGAINAVLGREITQALLGKSIDEATRMAKDAMTPDVVEAEVKAKVLARPLRCRGNVVVDDFGPTLLVHEAAFLQRDLASAAEALLAELEEAI
jgi:replication factor A1